MARIIECIPNFSEGRRPEIVDDIVRSMTAVSGIFLLDREMDANHNRAVITFVGDPAAVFEAAFRGIQRASELIDLRTHRGEHPRMGAADVVPFVPISGVSLEECAALARRLGARVGEELNIPVFLYEAAATRAERQDLAVVRQGEFEGLREAIGQDPTRDPDFGPRAIHATAGAVAIGARMPLIAFNVNLATRDVGIAQKIAEAVRFRSGGLRFVKALGFDLRDRGMVQVSMNLTNYLKSPLYRVFEMIQHEAAYHGVRVVESEIVGLVPAEALYCAADRTLRLAGFKAAQVFENRLAEAMSEAGADGNAPRSPAETAFLDRVAAGTPTPGGGSAAAFAAALASSLGCMVCNLTLGKKKFAAVTAEMSAALKACESHRTRFERLVEDDAAAFDAVLTARRLSQNSPEEVSARDAALAAANLRAATVPLTVIAECLELTHALAVIMAKGNPNSATDVGVAAGLVASAARGASLNVRVNLPSLDESSRGELGRRVDLLLGQVLEATEKILADVDGRLGKG